MTLKRYDAKFKEKLTFGSKNGMRNLVSFNTSSTSLKICTSLCNFCRKYIMFEPKMYREFMYHNTEEWYKIWRGTDLRFVKWHEEFGKFWPNTWKSQNFYYNGLLLTKEYNVWTERSYTLLYWRLMQTLKEKWFVVS